MLRALASPFSGLLILLVPLASAEEKTVLLADLPRRMAEFTVRADGKGLYFASGDFLVLDDMGRLIERYGTPTAPRKLLPLPDGWFIAVLSHAQGQIARYRPDGTYAEKLVGRGAPPANLRGDMTGWTSPTNAAVDVEHDRLFVIDTTMAPRDDRQLPDPDWSRIAVYDLRGTYLGQINDYSAYADDAAAKDDRRTWYGDIEVDPNRRRVYVTGRRTKELLAFTYDGQPAGRVTSPGNAIAVFSNGEIAVSGGDGYSGGPTIQLYSSELEPTGTLEAKSGDRSLSFLDLDVDSRDRLYASTSDPRETFVRWSTDRATYEIFGPDYTAIRVDFPAGTLTAGQPLEIRARVEGRPAPEQVVTWQVVARPSDGRSLDWQPLSHECDDGVLRVNSPADMLGPYELAVVFGDRPIAWGDRAGELYVQTTRTFAPAGVSRSVSLYPSSGRRAYQPGESIALEIVCRGEPLAITPIDIALQCGQSVLGKIDLEVEGQASVQIPAHVTRRLPPGSILLSPTAKGHRAYPLELSIGPSVPDSPLQRILYHEFDNEAVTMRQIDLADTAERMDYVRRHVQMVRHLGFTRETDRLAGKINADQGPAAWRRAGGAGRQDNPALPPAEYFAVPALHEQWEAEFYLDQAVTAGVCYDSQLLGHCDGVRFRDYHLNRLRPVLQQTAQWLGRYPSFYGFNYNDEMFFGGWAQGWTDDDKRWLERVKQERFSDRPHADHLRYALRVMYDAFNEAVRTANPAARITATPMWQYPAVEGSYAPEIYRDMSESYSHYLSEGYQYPWYPAHSVEFLRRPGLPLMGVFDNGYGTSGGDLYVKNLMQVLARGVQGAGVQHTAPGQDAWGASAFRTANLLAKMYGPVFAEMPPVNEAAVLYSYTQDVTERRNSMGTPHWERVFELNAAGLMAGVPMQIVYEEDVAAGSLIADGKPVVPMLFLVGQQQRLPAPVEQAIGQFIAVGGRVLGDENSKYEGEIPGLPAGNVLPINTHRLRSLWHEGYAADTIFPLFQPVLEEQAQALRTSVEPNLWFPMRTDDPWISKNSFDGGAVRYVMLAAETSPLPWDAGNVWSLGAMYCKRQHTYLPKVTTLEVPAVDGVVYDLFDQQIVQPETAEGTSRLTVDLRSFPARLYAIAPKPVGAPSLSVTIRRDELCYAIQNRDDQGLPLAARVPVRIRLFAGERSALDVYRSTDRDGSLVGRTPLPVSAQAWTCSVTTLLGGRGSVAEVPSPPLNRDWLIRRPAVELLRADRVRQLLDRARSIGLTLRNATEETLTAQQHKSLRAALATAGIELKSAPAANSDAATGVVLTLGQMQGGRNTCELIAKASSKGLFPLDPSENVPGPGRGFITAVYAPRARGEDCIAVMGGDASGLAVAVEHFTRWLTTLQSATRGSAPEMQPSEITRQGQPSDAESPPRLTDLVGVRLAGVKAAAAGGHLLVSAEGYWDNLALVEDAGDQARVVSAMRVGQAPSISSLFLSPDASWFGASGRTVDRCGEKFSLFHRESPVVQEFPCFGDIPRMTHHFGVSSDAKTVIAPGSYGVVCWRRDGDRWTEAWSIDYWQQFARLDWPVSDVAERGPQFHACIPGGADYALIVFGEFSNNGWVKPEYHCRAWLAAVDLADGTQRWRFDVPITGALLFPHLHTSADGGRMLLHVQMGSWNTETHRYFSLDDRGRVLGTWDTGKGIAPLDVAIAGTTGRIALVFKQRLIEIRDADGGLRSNALWPSQPIDVTFAAGGDDLILSDEAGLLTRLDPDGRKLWQIDLGCVCRIGTHGERIYAAGWDGRLRSLDSAGRQRWALNCTPHMNPADPGAALAALATHPSTAIHAARRTPTTSGDVPSGDNLLRSGKATLTVGGTKGWMSEGKLQIRADTLTNGRTDDPDTKWLHLDELFWNGTAGRQVWAEISLSEPTDVTSLTVYEHLDHRDSWPTEAVVQVWNEQDETWQTAAFGIFLDGPVNTYALNLKSAKRLRYLPWNSYFRNFYTSEIEVR